MEKGPHSGILPTAIPLPLSEDVLKELVPKARDWALMHGAGMRSKTSFSPDALNFAPFVLTPSAFPREQFEKARNLQPILNRLTHAVAHDRDFLEKCLRETIQVDSFTRRLFELFETINKEGATQLISLGILRSDYLLNDGGHVKQVEINTIASSFGGIGTLIKSFNSFVLEDLGYPEKVANLPENRALRGICTAMLQASTIYGVKDAVILFIVEDITYNICDQRFHEFEIAKLRPGAKVKRRTLTEIAQRGKLGDKRQLIIDGFEVSVVYFRAGYEPGHYHSEKEWDARLLIERSLAIKCPSIHYHLAGTKKVQQELARPGALERFLKDANEVRMVREVFTGLYSLDMNDDGDANVQMALSNPDKYVLKPQREGGGNNIYGEDIRPALAPLKESTERTQWILMDRITPPIARSYVLRPGAGDTPEMMDLVSELGIFGYILGDKNTVLENKEVGHMLRTKVSTANEGGVAAGLGAMDSPYLY